MIAAMRLVWLARLVRLVRVIGSSALVERNSYHRGI
jgi:hypothetical protein